MLFKEILVLITFYALPGLALRCYNCTSEPDHPNPDCFGEASGSATGLVECSGLDIYCSTIYFMRTNVGTTVIRSCDYKKQESKIVEEIAEGYAIYSTCSVDGCNGDDRQVIIIRVGNLGNPSAGLPSFVLQLSLTLVASLCATLL